MVENALGFFDLFSGQVIQNLFFSEYFMNKKQQTVLC